MRDQVPFSVVLSPALLGTCITESPIVLTIILVQIGLWIPDCTEPVDLYQNRTGIQEFLRLPEIKMAIEPDPLTLD